VMGNIDDSYLVGRVKRGERIRSAYGTDDSQTYDDKRAAQKNDPPYATCVSSAETFGIFLHAR
jgi:hypothetical protein